MTDLEEAIDLLRRIRASIDDGTIDIPDVEGEILDEIDDLIGAEDPS